MSTPALLEAFPDCILYQIRHPQLSTPYKQPSLMANATVKNVSVQCYLEFFCARSRSFGSAMEDALKGHNFILRTLTHWSAIRMMLCQLAAFIMLLHTHACICFLYALLAIVVSGFCCILADQILADLSPMLEFRRYIAGQAAHMPGSCPALPSRACLVCLLCLLLALSNCHFCHICGQPCSILCA